MMLFPPTSRIQDRDYEEAISHSEPNHQNMRPGLCELLVVKKHYTFTKSPEANSRCYSSSAKEKLSKYLEDLWPPEQGGPACARPLGGVIRPFDPEAFAYQLKLCVKEGMAQDWVSTRRKGRDKEKEIKIGPPDYLSSGSDLTKPSPEGCIVACTCLK